MPARLTLVPSGLVLAVLALADRAGVDGALFYFFLAGVVVTAAAGLAGFGRIVDATEGGAVPLLGRVQAALSAVLVALLVAGAASRSPAALALDAPGLASVAIVAGVVVLAVQVSASLVAVGERDEHERVHRRLLSLDADAAERLDVGSVR
jgi:hypothetical protein